MVTRVAYVPDMAKRKPDGCPWVPDEDESAGQGQQVWLWNLLRDWM